MSQPPGYTPTRDFSQDEANNVSGRSTVNTAGLDTELANIEATLDATLVNLALIQRDDGEIRDAKVKTHTLSSEVLALFAAGTGTIRGPWVTATSYAIRDVVTQAANTYICAIAHTSGVFATDLAANRWLLLALGAQPTASGVSFTPTSTIAATNVQAAIEEVNTEIRAEFPSLLSLASSAGATLVGWIRSATGAVATTLAKWLDWQHIDVFSFMSDAQIADIRAGTLAIDVSAAFQAAINEAATKKRVLRVQTGYYRLDSQLNINNGPVTIIGEQRDRTRLFPKSNAPCFNVTSIQFTLRDLTIEGEQNGAKTLQVGVYVNNVNQFVTRDCTFTRLYNSIQLHEVCFFTEILDCIFGDNVFAHLKTTGTAAAGNEFSMRGCQIIPATAQFGLHIENAGSMVLSDCRISPANMTGECLKFVSRATLAGVHKFVNTLFEGSSAGFGSVRLEGTVGLPINFCFFSNCYFNQNGAGDCVTLLHTQYTTFSNCYFSGTNRALNINTGINRGTKLVNCDFQLATTQPVILGTTPAQVRGLHITNPTWTGSTRFIDLSSIAAADIDGLEVIGGDVGTHVAPILVPSAAAVRVRRVGTKGVNQFDAGGVAVFSGTGAISLFAIAHGLAATPTVFQVVPNSIDAGTAEIREITVNGTNINVQCKASAASGTNNVSWSWWARC